MTSCIDNIQLFVGVIRYYCSILVWLIKMKTCCMMRGNMQINCWGIPRLWTNTALYNIQTVCVQTDFVMESPTPNDTTVASESIKPSLGTNSPSPRLT